MKKNKKLSSARKILELLSTTGILPVEAFTISTGMEYEYDPESFEAEVTICFNVFNYLCMFLGGEFNGKLFTNHENALIDLTTDFKSLENGLYYVDLNSEEEGHHFVWIVESDQITYAGGYGGARRISVKTFDKEEYFRDFAAARNGNVLAYGRLICEVPAYNTIHIQSIKILKSGRWIL